MCHWRALLANTCLLPNADAKSLVSGPEVVQVGDMVPAYMACNVRLLDRFPHAGSDI
jgi:hypothetical protein